jgi:excisionase family DNA binding protein
VAGGAPAAHLKQLSATLSTADLTQLILIFTSRANPILGDFVRHVYWARYAGGYTQITNEDARTFVERGIDDGKTIKRWSETTVRRVSAYLTGCCADYGMLERGVRSSRRILPFRISPAVAAYLAFELHFSGVGDNALLTHEDWQLFGVVGQGLASLEKPASSPAAKNSRRMAPRWCKHENLVLSCTRFSRLVTTMPSSADEGEILTLKQVADFLKVTERTIYRLAAAKQIPSFKVGGTWRFSRAEINQWIQRQQEGGKADKT